MKVSDVYRSKFLRGTDLQGAVTVTIARVVVEQIGDDRKLVVYFEGARRALPLNRTNATSIAEIVGSDETDQWPGTQVSLRPTPVLFQGKTTPAIRVYPASVTARPPAPAPAPARPAPTRAPEQGDPFDEARGELTAEDIPF